MKSTYSLSVCILRVCIYIHGVGVYIYMVSYLRCVHKQYIRVSVCIFRVCVYMHGVCVYVYIDLISTVCT